jgi:hypothetical protein
MTSAPASTGRRAAGLMASAAVVAVVIAAVAVGLTKHDPPPSPSPPAAAAMPEVRLEVPDGTLEKAPAFFGWKRLAGATAYEVRLYADDATILWTSRQVDAITINRPPSIALPSAHQYHWQVRAFADGKMIGESRLATFEIIPR